MPTATTKGCDQDGWYSPGCDTSDISSYGETDDSPSSPGLEDITEEEMLKNYNTHSFTNVSANRAAEYAQVFYDSRSSHIRPNSRATGNNVNTTNSDGSSFPDADPYYLSSANSFSFPTHRSTALSSQHSAHRLHRDKENQPEMHTGPTTSRTLTPLCTAPLSAPRRRSDANYFKLSPASSVLHASDNSDGRRIRLPFPRGVETKRDRGLYVAGFEAGLRMGKVIDIMENTENELKDV